MGQIADGTYGYLEGAIAILAGPTGTYEKLIELQNFLLREQTLSRPFEHAAAEVKRIEPKFSDLFNISGWSTNIKSAAIGGLAIIVVAFIGKHYNQPIEIINPVTVINQYGGKSASELLRSNPTQFVPPIPKARPAESEPNRAERRRLKSQQRRRTPPA